MLHSLEGTSTFPDPKGNGRGYTLDGAYYIAQRELWTSFFGGLLSWALFACALLQFGYYFTHFKRDHIVLKGTIFLLLLIELASTAFLTWTTYVTQVKMWGHEPSFAPQTWGNMLFDCTTASIVHAMYIWRICKLTERHSRARLSTAFIGLLSLAQFGCCLAAALLNALQNKQSADKRYVARRLFHTWLACASSADIVITLVIAMVLYCSRTGAHATDTLLKKILLVTAPGGAITAILQMLILILQLRYTDTTMYQMIILILPKFYSNSVLLCFNLRAKLSGTRLDGNDGGGKAQHSAASGHDHTVTTYGHSDGGHSGLWLSSSQSRVGSGEVRACPWLLSSSSPSCTTSNFDRQRPTTLDNCFSTTPANTTLSTAAGGTLTEKYAYYGTAQSSPGSGCGATSLEQLSPLSRVLRASENGYSPATTPTRSNQVSLHTRGALHVSGEDNPLLLHRLSSYTHDSSYATTSSLGHTNEASPWTTRTKT